MVEEWLEYEGRRVQRTERLIIFLKLFGMLGMKYDDFLFICLVLELEGNEE